MPFSVNLFHNMFLLDFISATKTKMWGQPSDVLNTRCKKAKTIKEASPTQNQMWNFDEFHKFLQLRINSFPFPHPPRPNFMFLSPDHTGSPSIGWVWYYAILSLSDLGDGPTLSKQHVAEMEFNFLNSLNFFKFPFYPYSVPTAFLNLRAALQSYQG